MNQLITILATVLVFGLMIFIHELGHFLAARRAGVFVHEFALGFGPRLFHWKKDDTEYSLRALPLGGFVRMAGFHPEEEGLEQIPKDGWFVNKTIAQRAGIIFAGPAMNIVLAIALFATLFGFIGVPEPTLQINAVQPGMPAREAGLEPGDEVTAIDGRRLASWDELVSRVQASPGTPLTFTVERDGRTFDVTITPEERAGGIGVVGLEPATATVRLNPARAVVDGVVWTGQVAVGLIEGLTKLIVGRGGAEAELVGPVGIGAYIGEAARSGLSNLMFLTGILSANLALVNLLPIPALDGSRLVFLFLEWVRGKPIDPAKENFVHLVGLALLLILAVVITYRDIIRIT